MVLWPTAVCNHWTGLLDSLIFHKNTQQGSKQHKQQQQCSNPSSRSPSLYYLRSSLATATFQATLYYLYAGHINFVTVCLNGEFRFLLSALAQCWYDHRVNTGLIVFTWYACYWFHSRYSWLCPGFSNLKICLRLYIRCVRIVANQGLHVDIATLDATLYLA